MEACEVVCGLLARGLRIEVKSGVLRVGPRDLIDTDTAAVIRAYYSWIEKAQENGLKFYRAPNTRGVMFEINEVLEWIRNAV